MVMGPVGQEPCGPFVVTVQASSCQEPEERHRAGLHGTGADVQGEVVLFVSDGDVGAKI